MASYVPLFASLTTGTLCGKWPDVGLWPIVLSLADRHGVVDVTCAYLARVTGLAEPDVVACMARFCEPDPGSRTRESEGRRLIPLDPERGWGWRVVNHGAYRERARKAAHDARLVDNGDNARRMRERRDPTRPAMTRDHPPSKGKGNGNAKIPDRAAARPDAQDAEAFAAIRKAYPKRSGAQRWPEAQRRCLALVRTGVRWEDLIAGAERYRVWCETTGKLRTEHVMQAATFYGDAAGYLEPFDAPPADRPGARTAPPARRWESEPTPDQIERARRDAAAQNAATVARVLPNLRVER